MTMLKRPYKKEDQIRTENIIKIGKRLEEIRQEIYDMTLEYGVNTESNVFSKSIDELVEDIIKTLGYRQLKTNGEKC